MGMKPNDPRVAAAADAYYDCMQEREDRRRDKEEHELENGKADEESDCGNEDLESAMEL